MSGSDARSAVRIGVTGLGEDEVRRRLDALVEHGPSEGAERLARLERYQLRIPLEQGADDAPLFEAYRRMLRTWNVAEPPPLSSHRPLVGPWIVRGKRLVRRLLAFEVDPFFERQASFNRAVLDLVRLLLAEVSRLRKRVRDLESERRDR